MMICPACGTQYSDDTLRFCLQDGTSLTVAHDANTEVVTQVRSGGQLAETRFVEGQSQVTRVGSLGASEPLPSASNVEARNSAGLDAACALALTKRFRAY